jgi:hypothetical protein
MLTVHPDYQRWRSGFAENRAAVDDW